MPNLRPISCQLGQQEEDYEQAQTNGPVDAMAGKRTHRAWSAEEDPQPQESRYATAGSWDEAPACEEQPMGGLVFLLGIMFSCCLDFFS